jgi:prepilin-type N-terminal cleavage/methylation domain-containing protein
MNLRGIAHEFSRPNLRLRFAARGFLLIEVLIAISIFAIGVLALGSSVENIIQTQILKEEDEKVRRYLEARMTEIEAGSVPLSDSAVTEDVKDWMPKEAKPQITTKRTQLKRKNEKDQDLFGLYLVEVNLTWLSGNTKQSRAISFYIYPDQR